MIQQMERTPVVTVMENEPVEQQQGIRVGVLAEGDDHIVLAQLRKLKAISPRYRTLQASRGVADKDLIVVYLRTEDWGRKALRAIRSRPASFLTPVLLIHETEPGPMADVADHAMPAPASETQFQEAIDGRLRKISEALAGLPEVPTSTGDTGTRKLLLLRYLYSREHASLAPQLDRCAKVGYTYPLARMLFKATAGAEAAHLESLEEAQLLLPELVDKVNLCPHCEHTQLNFRELCPHCNSLNISEESTIHHFRCAFVGRESEFARGAQLICPKCHNELRHIGVDYDKPSEVLWCNACKNNFSDPKLSCFCLACSATFAPEDAFIKQISKYTLSQDGFRAAEEGAMPGYGLLNLLKQEIGFYKKEVFLEYLRLEIARCKRYGAPSTLSKFYLQGVRATLEENLAISSRRFKRDFASVLHETYRKTDLFTELPGGDILILFLNTSSDHAKIAYQRLADRLKTTFKIGVKLRFSLHELAHMPEDVEQVWENLR